MRIRYRSWEVGVGGVRVSDGGFPQSARTVWMLAPECSPATNRSAYLQKIGRENGPLAGARGSVLSPI